MPWPRSARWPLVLCIYSSFSSFSVSVAVAGAASYRRSVSLPSSGHHGEVGVDRSRQGARQIVPRAEHGMVTLNTNGDSNTTRVAADPDTHQDFQPTSKGSDMSYHDTVAKDIKENPVLIYMKGSHDAPRCGFSALAVKVLQLYDVPVIGRDILSNLKLKESVKAHTNWPTFPQIFIKGEFVGGSDIILSMHQKGELKDLLADIAQKGKQSIAS